MKHITEIFNNKDISFLDKEYTEFIDKKEKYIESHTDESYFNLMFSYESLDAYLKSLLSDGYLSFNEFQHIRDKLKEGVEDDF